MNIIEAINRFYNLVKIAIQIEEITSQKQAMIKLELLSPEASDEEARDKYNSLDDNKLKKIYYRLASIHHPDKGGSSENFQEIKAAFEYLKKDLDEKNPYIIEGTFYRKHKTHVTDEDLKKKVELNKEIEELRARREEALRKAKEKEQEEEKRRQSILENFKNSPLFTGRTINFNKKQTTIDEPIVSTFVPETSKPDLKPKQKPKIRSLFDPLTPEELNRKKF